MLLTNLYVVNKFFFLVMKTSKIYSLSNFEIYGTVLTIVTMLLHP